MPLGELAALATASCWAITSLVFAEASRRIGPLRVNLLRLPLALVLLSVGLALGDRPFAEVTPDRVGLLAASAVSGLLAGDLAFFAALRRLGARLTSLLMALAPIFAALGGAVALAEVPPLLGLAGIVLTLSGVAWVVAERRGRGPAAVDLRGVLLGVAGAAGQGFGIVLAKLGMAGVMPPLTATWIRILAAGLVLWSMTALSGRLGSLTVRSSLRVAGGYVGAGAFFGPFLGVWLSLVAAKLTDVGVAATIMATSPVLVIPLVAVSEGYRPTPRALFGTVVAVVGVALLFAR